MYLNGIAFQLFPEAVHGGFEPLTVQLPTPVGGMATSRLYSRTPRLTGRPANNTSRLAGLMPQCAVFDQRAGQWRSAAQRPRRRQASNSCTSKGLDRVVVGTAIQTHHAVWNGIAGGHDEHGQIVFRPHDLARRRPRHGPAGSGHRHRADPDPAARHPPAHWSSTPRPGQVARDIRCIALLAQGFLETLGDIDIVLNNPECMIFSPSKARSFSGK